MPFHCASASFSEKDGDCELYGAGANVHGNGHLVADLAYTHYEKGCITCTWRNLCASFQGISAEVVELCKGYPLVREPQKTLLGFATATVLASSLIECLEFCFLEYRRGASCKSVMYFYDVGFQRRSHNRNVAFRSQSGIAYSTRRARKARRPSSSTRPRCLSTTRLSAAVRSSKRTSYIRRQYAQVESGTKSVYVFSPKTLRTQQQLERSRPSCRQRAQRM